MLTSALSSSGYVGRNFGAPKRIHSATIYGSNNSGFSTAAGTPNMTIQLRGSNSAPAAGSDGTLIGDIAVFADTANESAGRAFTIYDQVTAYQYVWAYIQCASVQVLACAELALNEASGGMAGAANFATSAAEAGAISILRILKNNWGGSLADVVLSKADAGSTATPDPAIVQPGWGTVYGLWIAAACASSVATVNFYPDGFGNGSNAQGGSGTTGASVSLGYTIARASEYDPGTFTFAAAAAAVVFSIAVKPAPQVTSRFAVPTAYLPSSIPALPNIVGIEHTPGVIGLGDGLGERASLTLNFQDHPHSDTGPGYDPYLSARSFVPFDTGPARVDQAEPV